MKNITQSYKTKIKKIETTDGAAYFTPAEIVSEVVSLDNARKSLADEEYLCISKIYEAYSKMTREIYLDRYAFLGVCNEIIAHFDLIAPPLMFCKDKRHTAISPERDEKLPYREKARSLIGCEKIFSEEWIALLVAFMNEFYA